MNIDSFLFNIGGKKPDRQRPMKRFAVFKRLGSRKGPKLADVFANTMAEAVHQSESFFGSVNIDVVVVAGSKVNGSVAKDGFVSSPRSFGMLKAKIKASDGPDEVIHGADNARVGDDGLEVARHLSVLDVVDT